MPKPFFGRTLLRIDFPGRPLFIQLPPDVIGNVGGTIGLFTGMSALSLVEILYWSGRGVASALSALRLKLKFRHK